MWRRVNKCYFLERGEQYGIKSKIKRWGYPQCFYYGNENPGLGPGFQKAFSVVLKKLPHGAKIFLVRQPKYQHGGSPMSKDNNSLAHTTWNCKYHIVFAPKYRRQIIYE